MRDPPSAAPVVKRLGLLPALVCIVVAAGLGVWGWGARADSAERVRAEADAAAEATEDAIFDLGEIEVAPVDSACGLLVSAALLEPPVDPSVIYGPPGASVTTLAVAEVDQAWILVNLLDEGVVIGIPELDHPDLRAAITQLRAAIEGALTRTTEPLQQPEVVDAATALRTALLGRCL